MKIFITGGTGFVGELLCRRLLDEGHSVTVLTRSGGGRVAGVQYIRLGSDGSWLSHVDEASVVFNLAGESIFSYWTGRKKEQIYQSRVTLTGTIAGRMAQGKGNQVLISASAVGFYGDTGDRSVAENDPPGSDFLATVCLDWEREALRAAQGNNRVVLARFGIVMGDGGAMTILSRVFSLFMGSRLGKGTQFFPWIHYRDLIGILVNVMKDKTITGPVNCVSPNPVTNAEMTRILARLLRRPVLLPFVPAPLIRLVLGEFGSMLLTGQRALPGVMLKKKFSFSHVDFEKAARDILGR